MANEKFPEDYKPSIIQRIFERISNTVEQNKKDSDQNLFDTTVELKDQLKQTEEKLTEKIDAESGDQPSKPITLPPPQTLTVYDLGLWGFALVDPFFRWKFWGKIRGYEFFGSPNLGFTVEAERYTQYGNHFGNGTLLLPDVYLNTKDPETDPDLNETFILDHRLLWPSPDGLFEKLIIENLTQGTSGEIQAYSLLTPRYAIRATGVTWVEGDEWRIKNYPQNRLFNVGSFCIFPKRLGNFYVKARCVGRGLNYSDFTAETDSSGIAGDADIAPPTFVYPVHSCGETCDIKLDGADRGLPICPVHGLVYDWKEIVEGTRETDHIYFFGLEWCNVEVVYREIDDEDINVFYQVRRDLELISGETVDDDSDAETDVV